MSSLHHSFDVSLAAQYGVEEAILIHHFQYWIQHNKNQSRNFLNNRTWMYQTREEIAAHFPYLSFKTVRRICEQLVSKGVLITGNFNKKGFDKTLWYAFREEEKFINSYENSNNFYEGPNGHIEKPERAFGDAQTGTPIPNTKTYSKTNSSSNAGVRATPPTQPSDPEKEQKKNFIRNSKWPQNYIPDEEHIERWSNNSMANLRKALRVAKEKMPRDCDKPEAYITTVLRNAKSTDHIEDNLEKVMELKNQGYLKSFEIRFDQLVHVTGKKIPLDGCWNEVNNMIKNTARSLPKETKKEEKTESTMRTGNEYQNRNYFENVMSKLSDKQKEKIKIVDGGIKFTVKCGSTTNDEYVWFATLSPNFMHNVNWHVSKLAVEKEEIDFKIA